MRAFAWLACLFPCFTTPLAAAINENGMSPLLLASYFGSANACDALLGAKADIHLMGPDMTPCLIFAVSQNHVHVVDVLTSKYGDIVDQTRTANQNVTALYLACQENLVECTRLLLTHSTVALEQCKTGGVSPLYIAAHEGHTACVELLLNAKAEVSE